MSRADVKKRAATALRIAGREHLSHLGLSRTSSSSRFWTSDHGWWAINVEFQPHKWSVASYLNVGIQHFWDGHESRYFGYSSRLLLPGLGNAPMLLEGTDDAVTNGANVVARTARDAVLEWRQRLPDTETHLNWLATDRTAKKELDQGIALGLLGHAHAATETLTALAADMDPTIEWQRKRAEDALTLVSALDGPAHSHTQSSSASPQPVRP